MNDCIWYAIKVCNFDNCKECKKHVSINSKKGEDLKDRWTSIVELALIPLVEKFAKENGFKEE